MRAFNLISKLEEVLDKPYPYEWEFRGGHYWKAVFQTEDENEYHVVADEDGDWWSIHFYMAGDDIFHPMKHDITGTGDSFRVMSTVFRVVMEFLKESDAKKIKFSSAESSRTKLYQRFVKYLETKGWYANKKRSGEGSVWYLKHHSVA